MSAPSNAAHSHSTPAVRSPVGERTLFLLGLLVFGAAISLRKLGDFDLPWHIALGRAMVALRAIPKLDPLAYTAQRVGFIEPLSEIPLYALWRAGGALALQIAGGALAAGIGYWLFRPLRNQGPLAYAAVALALAAIDSWLVVRPATLSFLLIALLLGLIELHRQAPSEKIQRRVLWCWPILLLFWASAHGFAFMGAGLCVAYAAYRGGCRLARGRLGGLLPERDGSDAGATALAAGCASLAALLNVGGPIARLGPSRFSEDATARFAFERVTESAPPSIGFYLHHEPLGPLLLGLALVALLFGKDSMGKRVLPTAFDVALVLLGAIGLLWVVRAVPLAVLLITPVIGRRLGAALAATSVTRWALATAPYLAAGFALLNPAMNLGVGFDPTHFPERACDYIVTNDVRGHMFNFSPLGGYLAMTLGPERKIFMDGRAATLHDISLVTRADRANTSPAAFSDLAREFDMQYAVTGAREGESFGIPLAQSPDWALVHWDDVAAVYVRRQGLNARLVDSGYQLLSHLTGLGEVLSLASRGGPAALRLRHDGQLAVTQDPTSARAAFLLACGELAARNQPGFLNALGRLSALAPEHPAIRLLGARFQQLRAEAGALP